MSQNKGTYRVVFVGIAIVFLWGAIIIAESNGFYINIDNKANFIIVSSGLCIAIGLIGYFVVRWIIRGFDDDNKQETQEVNRELK